ncbi:RCC1/BLIP-II protein, partial [Daedalea quercina L-15889]
MSPPGFSFSLGLSSSGSNARGQLATGDTEDAREFKPCMFHDYPSGQLPEGTTAIANVVCGANHTVALLARHGGQELWGCGDGRRGQLGPSYTRGLSTEAGSSTVFRPLSLRLEGLENYAPRLVAAGWETSYVVFSCQNKSDVLISMGADDFGDLGVGGLKGVSAEGQSLHRVPLLSTFPDASSRQDDVLAAQALNAGPHHVVCVLRLTSAEGSVTEAVVGWGTARHGQLGDATAGSHRPTAYYDSPHVVALDGIVQAFGPITRAALGNQHTVFLHSSGNISGIGSNRKSQREGLDTVHDVEDVACTWNGTYAIVRDRVTDQVVATGSNYHGQLGRETVQPCTTLERVDFPIPTASHKIVKLACGSEHVLCVLEVESEGTTRKEVWGWGWNEHGNLGIGTTDDARVPIRICPLRGAESDVQVVDVWGGNGTSWMLLER